MKIKSRFITFEGGEGAGKSTQIPFIKEFLESHHCSVITTREPGGSEGAELIRNLLVKGHSERWDGLTEYLLLSAARRDHLIKVIKPALEKNIWVLCDRFFDSSVAYQGAGHGVDLEILYYIYKIVAEHLEPDLTFIFDISPKMGLERTSRRGQNDERFEQMTLDFHQRIYDQFKKILHDHPERCRHINATQTCHKITYDLQEYLLPFLVKNNVYGS